MTQLDVLNRQTTPTQHTRVLGSSFRCLDKEGKRPQKVKGKLRTHCGSATGLKNQQRVSTRARATRKDEGEIGETGTWLAKEQSCVDAQTTGVHVDLT